MNQDKDRLTKAELETLCRLYLDCKLTAAEEVELEYVLSLTAETSPLIDETRRMMSASRILATRQMGFAPRVRSRRRVWFGAAASVAVIIGMAVLLTARNESTTESQDVYIAYVSGRQVSEAEARRIAQAELETMHRLLLSAEKQKAEAKAQMDIVEQIENEHNEKNN
ncbi:MAG: hypothetical protein K2M19_00080 [Muribaculaceae bacterium]|nr:hypothetical protein [Muribaculaceae bacterium]